MFTFISTVLSGTQTIDNTRQSDANSQKLAILEAPVSPKLATGGAEVTIVDESALEYESDSGTDGYKTDQISTYVVHEGDTLSQIAKMFDVSVNTIVWANDIKNGVITPGQTLVILPVSGIRYKVKSGDTIQSIVKKHEADLDEVLQYNNLTLDSKLGIGDEIIIPNAESHEIAKTPTKTTSTVNSSGYFIRPIAIGKRSQGIHGYNGVDLAAPVGTNIVASAAGKVIVSRSNGAYNGGYGNYVVVSHPNGTQTLYAHMKDVSVTVGDEVKQGELLGHIGMTGRTTGPHVHFEIRGAKNPF
ncbi:MAG TPA: peptidoglycan DD-metalloendopeptidase family protein [Candidatus Nanoarchaeia archaeon]|nr:peptidoglycan DD-metalloendopeptidase family protein [Candidatus Nanoarchaeia archaeon]